ncbi:NACHT, LRR and PYD domains-containing protein 6-like [Actinia tenebrosa]|uniref:NACHT, LRR and PYD domains-containing protein 6-like n=1 Tax=Actinia tenebrosa TaxID=6105 RepID=A0A6P8J0C9_ACTTE|nr:NACHT, LRR and PYD domains-containing protein 6-like [Actinia tenebrosa]
MADVVDPAKLLMLSSGKTNYTRLSRLLLCGGTMIMRGVLNYRLPRLLAKPKVKQKLKRMRGEKILHTEWKKLYPARGRYGKSETFDISLMFKLLREFSGLRAPRTGWDNLPDDEDLTSSADLVRIKYYRNKFSHDNGSMEVSDEEFKDIGTRIKDALVRMLLNSNLPKIAEWKNAMDGLLSGSKTEEDEVKLNQRIKDGGTKLKMFLRNYHSSGERRLVLPLPWMEPEGERFHIKNLYTQVKISEKDTDELVEMESLFSPSSGGLAKCTRILIEGEPGIGKSSLCKKIAYDWSMNEASVSHIFQQFELLFVLKCTGKQLHHEDIWSLIEEEILPKELCSQKEEMWMYIKEQQEKLLLIIDGFDEISTAHGSKTRKAVLDIISGKMLSRCHLIVTSRTDKESEIRKHFDKILNIRGFQWNESCNFFRKFFSSSPDKARDIISWIRKNNEVKELVGNPLYAAFTSLIFEEEQQDKLDLFGFFYEIVFCVTKRYCVEKQDQQVNDDTLMNKFHDEHLMLGKLALEMSKGQVDYLEEGVPFSHLSQTLKDLGFLSHRKVINRIRPKSCFCFSHSLIRKYFAAFYERESSRIISNRDLNERPRLGGWMQWVGPVGPVF